MGNMSLEEIGMHRDEAPALHGTFLGAALHYLNPIMRAILGSPLHPILDRWFLLLRWATRFSDDLRASLRATEIPILRQCVAR